MLQIREKIILYKETVMIDIRKKVFWPVKTVTTKSGKNTSSQWRLDAKLPWVMLLNCLILHRVIPNGSVDRNLPVFCWRLQ